MKYLKEKFIPLCFMVSLPIISLIYRMVNNPDRGVNSLITDIDRGIPFLKIFVVPYILWYVFVFGVLFYFCIKDRNLYYRTLIACNISIIICCITYFFYQTMVPRPLLTGNDILTRMVGFVYRNDQPYNCFPSIHSLTSYLMLKAISVSHIKNRKNHLIIGGMAFLIILSTFFIKQHVILDAVSAILLGDIVFRTTYDFNGQKVMSWIKRQYLLLIAKKKFGI